MGWRRGFRAEASRTGDATAGPGGYANTGVHVGDVYLAGGPVRSRYLELVRRIAPPELVEREEELAELAGFCLGTDLDAGTGLDAGSRIGMGRSAGGYRWWRAPAWAGKSALMAWFVLHPPPGVRLVSFFVTARLAGQSDRTAFLDSTLEQLADLLDRPLPAFLTDTNREAHFLGLLADAAEVCADRGERLVLLVDGLDEDRGVSGTDFHSIAATLPATVPGNTRVVVSSRPNPPVPDDVPPHHPLRDPAVVRPLAPSARARAIEVDMRRELDRLLTGPPVDQDLLGLLVASGGGLTATDLAELLADAEWPVWRVEEHLGTVAGRSFTPLPGPRRSFMLGHEELATTAVTRIGPERLDAYRARLHAWADAYRARGWPAGTPGYLLGGYHRMLTAHGDLPRMVAFASDHVRHDRMADTIGGNRTAIAEITATQHAVLSSRPDVTTLALLNVHLHVLAGRDWNIPVELPATWAALGDVERARSLARSISAPADRVDALLGIAGVRPGIDAELVAEAVHEAGELDDPDERGQVTLLIASRLAEWGRFAQAEQLLRPVIGHVDTGTGLEAIVTGAIDASDLDRAESLIGLLPDAGRAQRRLLGPLAMDHHQEPVGRCLARLVRAVLRHGDLKRATALARAIEAPFHRLTAWADLIEAAPWRETDELLREALDFAENIADPVAWEDARAASAMCFAAAGRFDHALEVVRASLPSRRYREKVLGDLVVRATRSGWPDIHFQAVLDAAQYPEHLVGALTRVVWDDRDWARRGLAAAEAAARLVPDVEERESLLLEVIAALAQVDEADRARAVADTLVGSRTRQTAMSYLAVGAARAGGFDDAWRLVLSICDPLDPDVALGQVARQLARSGRFGEAVSFARSMSQPAPDLARVALAAARAGDRDQATALAESAHAHARTASDHVLRYRWLTVLAPLVGDVEQGTAIAESAAQLLPEVAATDAVPGRGVLLARTAESLGLHDLADRVLRAAEHPEEHGRMLTEVASVATPARARALLDQAVASAGLPDSRLSWRVNVLASASAGLAALGDDRAHHLAQVVDHWARDGGLTRALLAETTSRLGEHEWTDRLIADVLAKRKPRDDFLPYTTTTTLVSSLANAGDTGRAEIVARTIADPDELNRALATVAIALVRQRRTHRAQEIAEEITSTAPRAHVLTELAKHDPEHLPALEQSVAETLIDYPWTAVGEGLALLRPDLPAEIHHLLHTLTVPTD
ncbi:P-loop NTPase family protein [Saccharothrix variisporea]|uniref:Uncharacterized protein n=1 Tax=Saccharothrix variisporea TaxID=543527 RepID=A0A495X8M2_9PSEU|nr:hypothetical protein [Saccharothrix variisporea]RKT69505.1 hypothetical protein DFJ66_2735 [Saccharothrix variisporea]